MKVIHTEHGKPDDLHFISNGILTVRKRERSAGKGTKKKRMPIINRLDRGYYMVAYTQLERVLTSKVVGAKKAL